MVDALLDEFGPRFLYFLGLNSEFAQRIDDSQLNHSEEVDVSVTAGAVDADVLPHVFAIQQPIRAPFLQSKQFVNVGKSVHSFPDRGMCCTCVDHGVEDCGLLQDYAVICWELQQDYPPTCGS